MRSEARLVHGVARRDPQALAALYDRYATVAYSILLRITKDGLTAEGLLHTLFYQAPELIHQYNITCHCLDAWMVLLARKVGIDHIRSMPLNGAKALPDGPGETGILEMAFFEGCSLKEMAERLKTPAYLVGTRLRTELHAMKDSPKMSIH